MKVALLVNKNNVDKYTAPGACPDDWELIHLDSGIRDVKKLIATNADAVLIDPITPFTAEMIEGMPNLKLIHSEGVGYNRIDLTAAKNAGVYVSNCAGVNALAVAEQAILLILALLRRFREHEDWVYEAKQIEAKTRCFEEGLVELAECHVGIIGLGAIGKELAMRLKAFGCRLSYYSRREVPDCDIPRVPLDEIYSKCDIISLNVPVTPETTRMINDESINKMKHSAIIINTARGELVDQEALCRALIDGRLGGFGLDTLSPEPVQPDNPIINLPKEIRKKVALSPHIAGLTNRSFCRSYELIWDNMSRVSEGKKPINIVNGL